MTSFIDILTENTAFASVERPGTVASNSEVRRWCKQGWVHLDGNPVMPLDEVSFPVNSVVIHTRNEKRRITFW